jgi:gamma-glutamyl-gamma-aminobutyrate hydrolase PuuD
MRPRIGATTYREPARWGVWDEPADLLPAAYARAIEAAGGVPVLLPPVAAELADAALDGVHGLLLAGGADVEPERYDALRDPHTGPPRTDRDDWELALVRAALARDLPVLAVCRGMQVLNVALGGDLIQHLPDEVGSELHCPTVGVHGRHEVSVASGSALAAIIGADVEIATYHHQAVRSLGAGLTATAWAADGVVEAVQLADRRWVHGVQWHPEAHDGHPLFTAFVAACRADNEVGAGRGE